MKRIALMLSFQKSNLVRAEQTITTSITKESEHEISLTGLGDELPNLAKPEPKRFYKL